MATPSPLKTFLKEHKLPALVLLGLFIILTLVIIIFTTHNDNDGVEGTDSRAIEASVSEDLNALKTFKITDFLPIVSKDPAYIISYNLNRDDNGNYSLELVLNAFAASARDACVARLLSENFGGEDPLKYDIILENYYNPFSNLTLSDLKSGNLPENVSRGDLYKFGDSVYTVQVLKHTLYDGSTNTYRFILEKGEPKTMPKLFFTYKDLPYLDESTVRSINSLS